MTTSAAETRLRWRRRARGLEFSESNLAGVQCPNCDDVELQTVSPRTDGRRDYHEPRLWCPQCDYTEAAPVVRASASVSAAAKRKLLVVVDMQRGFGVDAATIAAVVRTIQAAIKREQHIVILTYVGDGPVFPAVAAAVEGYDKAFRVGKREASGGPALVRSLRARKIVPSAIDVCGVTFAGCIAGTATDLASSGFKVNVLFQATDARGEQGSSLAYEISLLEKKGVKVKASVVQPESATPAVVSAMPHALADARVVVRTSSNDISISLFSQRDSHKEVSLREQPDHVGDKFRPKQFAQLWAERRTLWHPDHGGSTNDYGRNGDKTVTSLLSQQLSIVKKIEVYSVGSVFVGKAYRGQGYGLALYLLALQYASEHGTWLTNDFQFSTSSKAAGLWKAISRYADVSLTSKIEGRNFYAAFGLSALGVKALKSLQKKGKGVKAAALSAKYLSDKTASCYTCGTPLRATAVARNDSHLYQIGILYACNCGKSRLWGNSIRDERRFVDFIEGRNDHIFGGVRYTSGFCNDLFLVTGDKYKAVSVADLASRVLYSSRLEDDGTDAILAFYRAHYDDVKAQLSPQYRRILEKAGTPVSAKLSDAPTRSKYKKTWTTVLSAPKAKGDAWVAQVAFKWREGPNSGKLARQMITLPRRFTAFISSGKLMVKPQGEPAYAWGTKTLKADEKNASVGGKSWSDARKAAMAAAKQFYAECKATKISGNETEVQRTSARRSVVQYNRARSMAALERGLNSMNAKQLAQHAVDMRFLLANVIDECDADTLRMYKARLTATDQRLSAKA